MPAIQIKRIYDQPKASDGYRILVDRLWPRGIKKEDARIDEWNKILPPSPELRKWFHQGNGRFPEFQIKYRLELKQHQEELNRILEIAGRQNVTLLYAAKDPLQNHAVILLDVFSVIKKK
ncbi:hypothetical protein D9M68_553480 [compost metagenome]